MKFHRDTHFCRIKMYSFMVYFYRHKTIEISINDVTFEPTKYDSPSRLCTDFFKGEKIECKKTFSSVTYDEEVHDFLIQYEKDEEGCVWIVIERA